MTGAGVGLMVGAVSQVDLLIEHGLIVDGSRIRPPFRADLAVSEGRVSRVGDCSGTAAEREIDALGLMVAPGFIDMHSHSDLALLVNPLAESKVRQGVTTEVIGNCGYSPAPVNEATLELLKREHRPLTDEVSWEWTSFSEYTGYLQGRGIAVNVAPLVGNGTLRIAAMGFESRTPTDRELEDMKQLLAESMEAGAFGLSSGLIYAPSCYADTEELIELAKVAAQFGGLYASHIRGEGPELLKAVAEAITIGREAHLPAEISHHKAHGRPNWGLVKDSLALIDEARREGLDVTCDVYPYTAGSTGLDACFPPWAHEGGVEKLMERLREKETRQRVTRDIKEGIPGWGNPARDAGWESIVISRLDQNPALEGKSVATIAAERGRDSLDTAYDLLLEGEGSVSIIVFAMRPEDVETVIRHPASMIGTDGSSLAPYGTLGRGKPHPRNYGTYPRVLQTYVREKQALSWEEAVWKMAGLPAAKLGLADRGVIKVGAYADLVLFNPETVAERGTYENPHQYPVGIDYIIVNGQVVIERGEHTKALPGRVLKPARGLS
ncbi:MAG: D-aminoacylase [Candidatus Bathyarchaeia archaeon]